MPMFAPYSQGGLGREGIFAGNSSWGPRLRTSLISQTQLSILSVPGFTIDRNRVGTKERLTHSH